MGQEKPSAGSLEKRIAMPSPVKRIIYKSEKRKGAAI